MSADNGSGVRFLGPLVLRCDADAWWLDRRDFEIDSTGRVSFDSSGACDEIDCRGMVVTPGLVNSHLHLGESHLAGSEAHWSSVTEYLAFSERINQYLSEEGHDAWQSIARFTASELPRNGCASAFTGRGWDVLSPVGVQGFAGVPLMNSPKLVGFTETALDLFSELSGGLDRTTTIVGVWLHSLYKATASQTDIARQLLDRGASFLTLHLSECTETRMLEERACGGSPVDFLRDHQLLDRRTILTHCGCIDSREAELIASAGATIVICPASNLRLRSSPVSYGMIRELGINWGIGTDGLATGGSLSLCRQTSALRDVGWDPESSSILAAITNGAKAVSVNTQAMIEAGGVPTLAFWPSGGRAELQDWMNWWLSADPSACAVWVNGRLVPYEAKPFPVRYKWEEVLNRQLTNMA